MYYLQNLIVSLNCHAVARVIWNRGKQRFKKLGMDTVQNGDERLHLVRMSNMQLNTSVTSVLVNLPALLSNSNFDAKPREIVMYFDKVF
jgi:hypothetical protein